MIRFIEFYIFLALLGFYCIDFGAIHHGGCLASAMGLIDSCATA